MKNKKLTILIIILLLVITFIAYKIYNKDTLVVNAKVLTLNLKDDNIDVEVLDNDKLKDKKVYINVKNTNLNNYKNINEINIGDYLELTITSLDNKPNIANAKALELKKLSVDNKVVKENKNKEDILDIDIDSLSEESKELIKKDQNIINYKPNLNNKENNNVPLVQNVLEYIPLPIFVTEKINNNQYQFILEESLKDKKLTLNVDSSMFIDEEEISVGTSYIMFVKDNERNNEVFTPKLLKEYSPNNNIYYRLETWDQDFMNKKKSVKLDIPKNTIIMLNNNDETSDLNLLKNKLALVGYKYNDIKKDEKSKITTIKPSSIFIIN